MTVAMTACASAPGYHGPRLLAPVNGKIAVAMPTTPVGTSVVIDLMHLCTSTGAPITIDRLTPVDPTGGIRITSWGVGNPGHLPTDISDGTRGVVHPGWSHAPVDGRCGTNRPGSLFAISVAADKTFGSMRAVRLDYNGQHVDADVGLSVCSTKRCALVSSL